MDGSLQINCSGCLGGPAGCLNSQCVGHGLVARATRGGCLRGSAGQGVVEGFAGEVPAEEQQLADLDTDGVAGRAAGRLGATPRPGSMERLIPVAEAGQDLRALLPDGLK